MAGPEGTAELRRSLSRGAALPEESRKKGSDQMRDRSSTLQVTESWAPGAAVFIRLALGFVFITEGIQKFLYPDALGVGRFIKIGIPVPEVSAPFVGVVEIVGGTLVLVGLLTRLGAFALLIDMIVAIVATKVPIL